MSFCVCVSHRSVGLCRTNTHLLSSCNNPIMFRNHVPGCIYTSPLHRTAGALIVLSAALGCQSEQPRANIHPCRKDLSGLSQYCLSNRNSASFGQPCLAPPPSWCPLLRHLQQQVVVVTSYGPRKGTPVKSSDFNWALGEEREFRIQQSIQAQLPFYCSAKHQVF